MAEDASNNATNGVITVDVEMPGGVVLKGTTVPKNYKTEQVIAGLLNHMKLPFVDDATAKPIPYSLMSLKGNFTLREGESFLDSKIEDGDTLKLFTTKPVASPSSVPELPFAPKPEDKEVKVYLRVLDNLKVDYKSLPLDVPVNELVRQIISDHKVQERDRFGQLGRFALTSKGAARVLRHDETLRQAGIMHEDRLTLHKTETPGGATCQR